MGTVKKDDIQQIRQEDVLSVEDAARQQDIIKKGKAWSAYCFASDTAGADIRALQQVVMEHGDGEGMYYFAKDVKGADIRALQHGILEHGTAFDAYRFARDVKDADIQVLQQVVLERGDGWNTYNFAKDIGCADLPALYNRLVYLHSTNDDGGYLAEFNADSDIQSKLSGQRDTVNTSTLSAKIAAWQQNIIESGDAYNAYVFAIDVPGADIQALQRVVMERGDGWDVYSFAKCVDGADIMALHSRLVELHSDGSDINTTNADDKTRYLDYFNNDPDIQARLKEQLAAAGQSAGGADGGIKHRPS